MSAHPQRYAPNQQAGSASLIQAPAYLRYWIALIGASIGLVLFEPAPVDILVGTLFIWCFVLGLMSIDRVISLAGLLIIIFLLTNIIPLYYVRDLSRSLYYAAVTFYLTLWFPMMYFLTKRYGMSIISPVLQGYIVFSLLSSLLSVLAVFSIIPSFGILTYLDHRALGFFKGPNVLASYLILTLLLLLYAAPPIIPRSLPPYVRYAAIVITLAALVTSGSRAGWGNAAVTLALVFYFRLNASGAASERFNTILSAVAGFTALGAIFLVLSSGNYGDFLSGRFQMQRYDAERFAAQESSLQHAMVNPLGIGPGQSESEVGTASIVTSRGPVSVHNLYIRVLVENGWLGFLSFTGFLGLTLWKGWLVTRSRGIWAPLGGIVTGVFVGTLLNSLVIDSLHWRHFWLQAALIWGIYVLDLKTSRTPRRQLSEQAGFHPPH